MLWESTDASTALHDRFGFGDPDDVARWLTSTLSSTWALHVVECDRVTISDQNAIAWVGTDRGPFVVKWSRAERLFPKLAGIADLIHALAEKGVPVAGPVASLDGSRRVVLSQGSTPLSVTVQPTMPGTHLDVADDAAVHAAGACLARLHDAMAGQRVAEVTSPARASAVDLREAIQTWLDVDDPLTHPDASARLRSCLTALKELDSTRQLVHDDYRAANILTTDSEVTAILDFDEVAWDHPVCDVAHASVYLATLFTDWPPTSAHVRRTFLDGYQSVRPLTRSEQDWLDALTLWGGIRAIPSGPDPAGWATAL